MPDTLKERPVYRNIHVSDLRTYRLPPAGIVSILHRISGLLMFLLMPFVIWLFDTSLTSEISFDAFRSVFLAGFGPFPAFLVKLATLGLIWAYVHHFCAGLRHLYMDATHSVTKEFGRTSAIATLAVSLVLTVLLGARLFGLY